MKLTITRKGDFNFSKKLKDYETLKRLLPLLLANEAQNHFLEGFRKGGYQTDASQNGWKPRKYVRRADKNRYRTKHGRRVSKSQGLLVQSGAMKNDIKRYETTFARTLIAIRNVPYAIYHNEGKGYIPKREFIGRSRKLDAKTIQIINKEILKIMR